MIGLQDIDPSELTLAPFEQSLTFSAFRATTSAELKYQPKAKPKVKLPKSSKKKTPNESEEDGMAPPPVVNESLERLDFGGMHMVRGLLIGKGWAEVIGRFKNLRYLEASGSRLTCESRRSFRLGERRGMLTRAWILLIHSGGLDVHHRQLPLHPHDRRHGQPRTSSCAAAQDIVRGES